MNAASDDPRSDVDLHLRRLTAASATVFLQCDPDLGLGGHRRHGFDAGNLLAQTVRVHHLRHPKAAISVRHLANAARHRRHHLDAVVVGFYAEILRPHRRLCRDRLPVVRHRLLLEEASATCRRPLRARVVRHRHLLRHLSIMVSANRLSFLSPDAHSPLPAHHRLHRRGSESAVWDASAPAAPDTAGVVLEPAVAAQVA